MAEIRDYRVEWSYDDGHRCDFHECFDCGAVDENDALAQFKKTNDWKIYSRNLDYFYYEIKLVPSKKE